MIWGFHLITGLPSEPKWGHLSELHKVIKTCEPTILNSEPTVIPLGPHQEVRFWANLTQDYWIETVSSLLNTSYFPQARVFNPPTGGCVAFLSNHDPNLPVNLTFWNLQYELPPWSISVLPDCRTAVYNSAIVSRWHFTILQLVRISFDRYICVCVCVLTMNLKSGQVTARKTEKKMIPFQGALQNWESYSEGIPSSDSSKTFVKYGLTEHLFLTRDTTDYLWYTTEWVNFYIFITTGFCLISENSKFFLWSRLQWISVYCTGCSLILVKDFCIMDKIHFST